MKWFKCLSPQSPVMLAVASAIGKNGAFEVMSVVCEAMTQEVEELDLEMVKKWADVKRDRAEKILPHAQKILLETLKIYGKSPKMYRESSEISQKSEDFTPSNPHGSTRDQERKDITEKKDPTRRMLRSTDEQKAAAVWMEEKIREVNPFAKPPNIETWANEIRLLVEQDGRSLDSIKELFSWANKDGFWRTNILSPGKLREKWDQLQAKRLNPVPNRSPNIPQGTAVSGRSIVPGEQREYRSGKL